MKTKYQNPKRRVLAPRYANYTPYTPPTSLNFENTGLTGTSTSGTTSTTGVDFWSIASTATNGIFSFLNNKQVTQQTLSGNSAQMGLSAEETKRTRIVVLGIVAVLLVIGAIALLKRK